MSSLLPGAGQARPQKRKFQSRASQACDMCRAKKAKCDQGRPCQTCQDREFTCVYNHVSARRLSVVHSSPSSCEASQSSNKNSPTSFSQPEATQGLRTIRESPTIPRQQQAEAALSPTDTILHSPVGPAEVPEVDTIGAINQHTSGTEFYGQSSNFVLLSQLLYKARTQLSIGNDSDAASVQHTDRTHLNTASMTQNQDLQPGDVLADTVQYENHTGGDKARPSSTSPMSIVNILYDENSTMTEASHAAQLTVAGRAQKSARKSVSFQRREASQEAVNLDATPPTNLESHAQETVPTSLRRADDLSNAPACFFGRPMLLEVEYVDLFFKNIHYIHPFLDPAAFKARCEKEIWVQRLVRRLRRDQMHFVALYNAVLAVGALTAGTDLLLDFRAELEKDQETGKQGKPPTSRRLSQLYFQRARRLLGDVFEVCSIESSQTLLLMSIYCQHALRPHACYMYSGMAVRNALAIGLPSDKNFPADSVRIASRKTWWCIYGQEIEISCASGRLSSASNAADYQIPFPENNYTARLDGATPNESHISIISEVGKLSGILHQASTELYHPPRHLSQKQRSEIAIELDERLDSWMAHLPSWLDPNSSDLKELEWENKQKLYLTIRFYAAKMFLHRPFLANSAGAPNTEFLVNIEACLKAAQKTVNVLYDAYKHRYYVRTWWYNSTYTLYASVILLYVVLLDCTRTPASELLQDVRKGLKVLQAMEEMDVARRSAELISEILKAAEEYVSSPQAGQARNNTGYNFLHDGSNESGGSTQPQAFDSNIFGSHSDPHIHGHFEDTSIMHSSHTAEVGSARDGILAGLMGQELLEGFGTGFNDLMLIDLEGPISDSSLGTGGEYAIFNHGNAENSGHWSWGYNVGGNKDTG